MEFGNSDGGGKGLPAAEPGVDHLRVRAARRRERWARKCERSGGIAARHALQSESDCAESGARNRVYDPRRRTRDAIPDHSAGSWRSGIYTASQRTRYLCRLRPTQAYGRDCHNADTVESLVVAGADSMMGSSIRSNIAPSS